MCPKKIRKQIYLTPQQDEELKTLSVMKGTSEASLVREAVAAYLIEEKERSASGNPLAKLVGLGIGKHTDNAQRHDEYLYGEEEK
jgi:predicted DNA-binding protein